MKKIAIALSFVISSSLAISIDEIVNNALNNNYDLKSTQKAILIANENIKLATKWTNPVLSIGANDIHFDEPLKRDSEAMQAQFIGLSQVIPIGKKLQIKESIAKKDKEIISLTLEDKKLLLKSKIYELSYNILILEKKLNLLNSYEKNIKKLEKLSISLYENAKNDQNEVLNAKIALSDILIQKQNLQNTIDNLYLKLEQISYKKIDNIKESLDIEKLVLNMDISQHPRIIKEELKSQRSRYFGKLEKENEIPDIKLNVTYFNRDDKYKDYANVSVNIPLSLYKSEKVRAVKAKLEANEIDSKLVDLKRTLKIELQVLQNNMNNSYLNYKLINQSIIPLKRKIQKNLENYNTLNDINATQMIKNLNELISFEIKAYDRLEEYFLNYSKSKYYMVKVK
ncbi:MAG: TolC family protein [Poseidonibacter sp.]|uniref:TolC family protein n=1 Tax=Poseidonibacter sp. TaxID=2321188 RepID=UPI00359E3827